MIEGLVLGDCLSLLPQLPDRSVDLVLCDPPYGVTARQPWDRPLDLEAFLGQVRRILTPRGVLALMGQGVFSARAILAAPDLYRYTLIWRKNRPTGFLNAGRQPLRVHEDLLIFYARQPVYHPQKVPGRGPVHAFRRTRESRCYGSGQAESGGGSRDRYPLSVLEIPVVNNDDPQRIHPNQKPVALGEWVIRTYTDPGAWVLDPCCGSGAFLQAAARCGRRFLGFEREPKFAHRAARWLGVPLRTTLPDSPGRPEAPSGPNP